jgi:hypothetical protein
MMSESMEQGSLLRGLLMKVAALEESVAYLEKWCEEQQDALDLVGAPVLFDLDLRDAELAGGEEVVELHQHAPGAGVEPAV